MDVSTLFQLPSVPASAINKRKWTAPPPGPNAQGSVVDIDHDKHEAPATQHAKRARVTTVDEDLEIEREGSSGGGDDGEHAEADQQALVRLGASGQTGALIQGRSGIQEGGGEGGQ